MSPDDRDFEQRLQDLQTQVERVQKAQTRLQETFAEQDAKTEHQDPGADLEKLRAERRDLEQRMQTLRGASDDDSAASEPSDGSVADPDAPGSPD